VTHVSQCSVCGSAALNPFIELGDVPIFCNVQWPTREQAAQASTARLSLVACDDCGHIFNAKYDPALLAYSPGYDNTQHFSSTFKRYAEALVTRLKSDYGIRNQVVVDIGCGRGDLLELICADGSNRGYGFDPSFAGARDDSPPNVTISKEYFTGEQGKSLQPSLVCCRHVLEHVPDPIGFLRTMRAAIDNPNRPVFYLEVPNGEHLLRSLSLWDYIYEHVSYFSKQSLELALRKAGFEVLKLYEGFGGQFLCADVRPATTDTAADTVAATNSLRELIAKSARDMNAKLDAWRQWAADLKSQQRRAAVWGAGSKGVMFLNLLADRAPDAIACAVDQNPNKHGQFISGSAQQVVSPNDLVSKPVDEVVLMNEIYLQEVTERMRSLGVNANLLTA
jgi:SAM-dependent methyltransferase